MLHIVLHIIFGQYLCNVLYFHQIIHYMSKTLWMPNPYVLDEHPILDVFSPAVTITSALVFLHF